MAKHHRRWLTIANKHEIVLSTNMTGGYRHWRPARPHTQVLVDAPNPMGWSDCYWFCHQDASLKMLVKQPYVHTHINYKQKPQERWLVSISLSWFLATSPSWLVLLACHQHSAGITTSQQQRRCSFVVTRVESWSIVVANGHTWFIVATDAHYCKALVSIN